MDDLELRGVIGSIQQRNLEPKIREGLEGLVKELLAINIEFQEDLLKVKTNDLLTEKGKAAKKQEIGDAILELLEPFRDAYQEHIESTERQLFADPNDEPKQPMELMLDQMRSMELRQMYGVAGMDALQIESYIDTPGFLEAIATSPKPLIPDARLKHLVREKAEKDNPQVAERLGEYDFASGTIKGLVAKIESDVRASGWKKPEDPLNPKPVPFVDEIAILAAS